ncbi:HEAT repeat domain-containing protein [Pseudoalteromonas sp. SMS1]|uniref:HEAT repeat domain-containing protein n=1 Tax=Pseudoalteromonas sp. SMS1 TaxID=2908894 RepID=UPI001F1C1086|nr:HEAT repeat domain-containing protein [Pseudoalteromonas sp. SMS1]MCF2860129.1 HEAT repeat domain-containing protein [Pseudoalteromonas sp. SMS1]
MITLNKVMLAGVLCALANSQYAQASCSSQYDFRIDTRTTFNYDQIKNQGQQTHIRLSGLLTIKKAEHNAEHDWWAIKADNVRAGSGQFASELDSYTVPFAFKLNQNGLITEFWFPTQLNKQAQDQLKGLAYYFQFQRNPENPSKLEHDTLGQYTVTYEYKNDKIQLNKQTYHLHNAQQGALQTIKIASSGHQITPSTCFFSARKGQETLLFSGQSQSLNLKTKQQYQISTAKQAYPSPLFSLPADLANWPTNNRTLSEAALTKLAQSLQRFVLENDLTQIPAYQLAQQLAQFDAVIDALSNVFLTQQLTDNAQMRLFNALGQLDSANSQRLLGRLLIDAEKDPLMQFRALRALSQGRNPFSPELTLLLTEQVEGGFTSLDSEVTSSFYMTIGAMLHGRQPDAQAQTLHDVLSEQLSLETDKKTQSALISGLGNSRNTQHFEQIDRYVNDTNKSVQKASIRALGMLQTAPAYESLEKQLAKPNHTNQVALLGALANYQLKPAASDAVLAIAVNNPSAESRYAAIKALASQNEQAGIKQTLKSALRSEKSKRNFQAIVELLHSATPSAQK